MFNLVVIGPPGTGKGTHSQMITGEYGLVHLSTGDMFREHIKMNTATGLVARRYIPRGELVPDRITCRMLYRHTFIPENIRGLLFDGFPRTLNQALLLDKMMTHRDTRINLVIGLQASKKDLMERIKQRESRRHRPDDALLVARRRMEVYEEKTSAVMDYYRAQGRYEEVSSAAPRKDVFRCIQRIIHHYMNKKPTTGISG